MWKPTRGQLEATAGFVLANRFVVQSPTYKQLLFLSCNEREVLFGGSAGPGKALHVETPIPTPTGWKTMGELRPGDVVFDERGEMCLVLACSEVMHGRSCYRVTFDCGTSIIADADHLWHTMTLEERRQGERFTSEFRARRRAKRATRTTGKRPDVVAKNKAKKWDTRKPPVGTVRTTKEIAATLRHGGRTNHSVTVNGPLQLPDAILPIDPYLLGIWLGDGTSSSGAIITADPEIPVAYFQAGYRVKRYVSKYGWGINGLSKQLRAIGVLNNKHIPWQYLRGSFDQRLELLRGLMDTDGFCSDKDGGCEFTSCNRTLAEQFVELLHGLGVRGSLRVGRATVNGKDCGEKYRVVFTPPFRAFNLHRKWNRQTVGRCKTTTRHYIVSVEQVQSVPVRCIAVDSPSRCFLAGKEMIPTHNSSALLMAAAMFVEYPSYAALILRRTYADLSLPGALMDRAHDWWGANKDCKWDGQGHTWTFPSGSTITFGYLETEKDKYRYASAEFTLIGFDELTQFDESQYRFLFSRLRKNEGSPYPLRMRSASNPGGRGHTWVRKRFMENPESRIFIPARIDDNPHLNKKQYLESLANLDPITRQQLEHGDWDACEEGRFKREWLRYYTRRGEYYVVGSSLYLPSQMRPRFLTVDPAATVATVLKPDPDFTVVSAWGVSANGELLWLGCLRIRCEVPDIAPRVAEMYERFGADKAYIEGGGTQKGVAQLCRRHKMAGNKFMNIVEVVPTKNKLMQAANAMNIAEAGRLWLPERDSSFPREDVEAELLRFTGDDRKDAHDDVVTTVGIAADVLVGRDVTNENKGVPTVHKMV